MGIEWMLVLFYVIFCVLYAYTALENLLDEQWSTACLNGFIATLMAIAVAYVIKAIA